MFACCADSGSRAASASVPDASEAANLLARATVPREVAEGIALVAQTRRRRAKHSDGDMFRRLVSRSLAAAWAPRLDKATKPCQFVIRTRAGADARSARLRATLERLSPRAPDHPSRPRRPICRSA